MTPQEQAIFNEILGQIIQADPALTNAYQTCIKLMDKMLGVINLHLKVTKFPYPCSSFSLTVSLPPPLDEKKSDGILCSGSTKLQ
jgi:hypothetical protein